ncbi:tRNA-dihydrouridine(47) synthase [NAD(P)(+)]-like [Anopheles bellator]|uniref:tRNA-dihydrouridine(47) synthase [NAD(P)(+)]-like n=1 Tax=Anopheles bellator TaxID=139047 RepID=UPI0026479770|nr:tRNA-dihydrouridine(47) synthase [NAD(P)(+)]-like [Anopheles bellator]
MDDGICHIKAEYLIPRLVLSEKPATEAKSPANDSESTPEAKGFDLAIEGPPPEKKGRFEGDGKRKKKNRGQNKGRGIPFKEDDSLRLCKTLLNGSVTEGAKPCPKMDTCRYSHDLDRYLQLKPKDIDGKCYIYSLKGFCDFGVTCRFAGAHLDENNRNIYPADHKPNDSMLITTCLGYDLQQILRKKQYNFHKSTKIVNKFEKLQQDERTSQKEKSAETTNTGVEHGKAEIEEAVPKPSPIGPILDEDLVKLRSAERKRINFRDKLYLSPLTTVGNLPFRRICKEYGVDVTCGEMACAIPIINGAIQEWALTKRHESEDLFGVQLCGHKPKLVTYAAQIIAEKAEVDFIDLNIGCPIDLIFNQGGGSALLRRQNVLQLMVQSCSRLLADYGKEFTVKTRVGIHNNKPVAHELVPRFEEWGASLVTIHGRTKEQRYTKRADWDYVQRCASQATTIPVFGNGDIYCYSDYETARERCPNIAGVMVGRGALIKPWVFQEIKERKNLDPSSSERFEMLKRYANYGLEHWGSDTKGVENTRRFLLEWQSFLYRYVPYGLLERPPQRINERPEAYRGRDDLETLMASPNCNDWVKLSEMLLGPIPDGFHFVPKHKANAY